MVGHRPLNVSLVNMSSVVVSPYRDEWPACFRAIRDELLSVLSCDDVSVEHIGSTSVVNLSAKPVIDVLVGVVSLPGLESRIPALARLGYDYRQQYEREIPERRYFVKAASILPRVHVHAVETGSPLWCGHLAFRDALRSDSSLAKEYEALKLRLAQEHPDDKELYTSAKAPFIQRVISKSRRHVR